MATRLYDGMKLKSEDESRKLLGRLAGRADPPSLKTLRRFRKRGIQLRGSKTVLLHGRLRPYSGEWCHYERELHAFADAVVPNIPLFIFV